MRFTPQCRDLYWLLETPIAHRGLHNKAISIIENTHDAFEAALQHNYAIECDLQISSNGEAMVFHDDALDRLVDETGDVKKHSAAALRAMSFKHTNNRMQTLGELLDQVDEEVPLVIELKSHWDGDKSLLLRAIDTLQAYQGAYALMSFDPVLVSAVAQEAPHIIRGITADRCVDPYYKKLPFQQRLAMQQFTHLTDTQPDFISYDFQGLPFPPVQRLRAAGMPVITWTIKSEAQAAQARRFSDQITFEGFAA